MALVETVTGKLVDQVKQLIGFHSVDLVMLSATLNESFTLGIHFGLDLLAHRPAQQIGATQRIARQDLRGLHHLFLIDKDAIGFCQNGFEQRVRIFDRDAAILPVPKQSDIVHRAGAIERDERDDISKIGGPDRSKRAAHPFGFQLKHADRIAALEQCVDAFILPFERIEIGPGARSCLDQVAGFLQDRKRLEAKKVELHEPGAFAIFHVELRHRHIRARIAIKRDELRQGPIADYHAGSMG